MTVKVALDNSDASLLSEDLSDFDLDSSMFQDNASTVTEFQAERELENSKLNYKAKKGDKLD